MSGDILVPVITFLAYMFINFVIGPRAVASRIRSSARGFGDGGLCVMLVGCITPVLMLLVLFDSMLGTLKVVALW